MSRKSKETARPQFIGGCTATDPPLKLAAGWRFAEDGSPGPDFHIVRCCAFRTRPDGDYRKLYKWAVRPSVQNTMRERIERLRLEILREDSEAIAKHERVLLARKNAQNGVRPPRRRKKSRR
jgi:hypothetical protein